jgi:hypothetical protein
MFSIYVVYSFIICLRIFTDYSSKNAAQKPVLLENFAKKAQKTNKKSKLASGRPCVSNPPLPPVQKCPFFADPPLPPLPGRPLWKTP